MTFRQSQTMTWLPQLFLLFLLGCPYLLASSPDCRKGTFQQIPNDGENPVCEPCPEGTFMPEDHHKNTECLICTTVEDPQVELLRKECNGTHDSDIVCVDGYYRSLPRDKSKNAECKKCKECDNLNRYLIQPCKTFEDAVCCPSANHEVIYLAGRPICQPKPLMCGSGHYFDLSTFKCLPCPVNEFMSLEHHVSRTCWTCQTPLDSHWPIHSMMIHQCNSTHPGLLGCESGYYLNNSIPGQNAHPGCLPCKICSDEQNMYTGRNCTWDHDTVCCPQPGMIVEDTPRGPECLSSGSAELSNSPKDRAVVCEEDQYMLINLKDKTAQCKSYTNETYLNTTDCDVYRYIEFEGRRHFPHCLPQVEKLTATDYIGITLKVILVIVIFIVVVQCVVFKSLPFARLRFWRRQQSNHQANNPNRLGNMPVQGGVAVVLDENEPFFNQKSTRNTNL